MLVGLELTLNYKIAISQNLLLICHFGSLRLFSLYSDLQLQDKVASTRDQCRRLHRLSGHWRLPQKIFIKFYKNILPIVRPLWQADWWPPSANNPTAYSFLPQLSGIGTDGISLSLLKGAQSSELTAMVAVVEQDSNRPSGGHLIPGLATIGRPWRGTGGCCCCVSSRVASQSGAASGSGPACCLLCYVTAYTADQILGSSWLSSASLLHRYPASTNSVLSTTIYYQPGSGKWTFNKLSEKNMKLTLTKIVNELMR